MLWLTPVSIDNRLFAAPRLDAWGRTPPTVVCRKPGLIAEIEQPGGEPAYGESRNDVGEWDQRFDRGFVAQVGQSHTIERDPHNRRREDIQPKIKQVEQDDQRERDGTQGGEEVGIGGDMEAANAARQRE